MKYEKIQTEILKKAINNKIIPFNYAYDEYMTYLIEGTYIVVIPNWCYFLDNEKIFKKEPFKVDIVKNFFKESYTELIDVMINMTLDNMEVHKFITNDTNEFEIYVNKKLLDIFRNDKYDNLKYYGKDSKSPVLIYNDEIPLGLILPINVR